MHNLNSLATEFDFLDWVGAERAIEYRRAYWLNSDFHAAVWMTQFGDRHVVIDFRVKLDDGELLTSPKHAALLDIFKCWLCVQTHPDTTGGAHLAAITAYYNVIRVLRLIDYFLIHCADLQLAQFGLSALSVGDIKQLQFDLASASSTAESIYQWTKSLSKWLQLEASKLSASEFNSIVSEQPLICEVDEDEIDLDLDRDSLVRARAFLWSHGLYKSMGSKLGPGANFRLTPNTVEISYVLYPNTLWGRTQKRVPSSLCLGATERFSKEFHPVPVRAREEDTLLEQSFENWRKSLRSLGLLHQISLPVPLDALSCLSSKSFKEALSLRKVGRFATPPLALVFGCLKNSIEFYLKYGDELIKSYLNLAKACVDGNMSIAKFAMNNDIAPYMTDAVKQMGVRTWQLSATIWHKENNPGAPLGTRPESSDEFFRRFRANEGLYELLCVLYGSAQVCVGTLMARRQSELDGLIATKCLDKTKKYLIFGNAKSGFDGFRKKEARPIPSIAARMIGALESLQAELIQLGVIQEPVAVFSRPHWANVAVGGNNHATFNGSFDRFCDYFETPLDDQGRRHYIRQHPLRRFFPMLFFWGSSFGGVETLQWFLGHTDVEHIYHYITESTPGAVLNEVKASFVLRSISHGTRPAEGLIDLIRNRFGTAEFSIIDSDELEEYLYSLVDEGVVSVEPQFFETPKGKTYKILVKITRQAT